MKRIDVGQVMVPDAGSAYTSHRAYTVHLGNKRSRQFTNAKDANAYRAATDRFLNELLHEVNALHGQAYLDYRMAWAALFHRGAALLGNIDGELQVVLAAGARSLDGAARGTDGPNRMHFAWKHVGDAAGFTLQAFEMLVRFYRYKTQGIWRHQAQIRAEHCKRILERLDDYGLSEEP